MKIIIGKYQFKTGKAKGAKRLDTLSLGEIKTKDDVHAFPKGRILIKKSDYALLKVSKKEDIAKRLNYISGKRNEKAKEYIIMYVNNCFVGYKTNQTIWFIPSFKKENFIKILREHGVEKVKHNILNMF